MKVLPFMLIPAILMAGCSGSDQKEPESSLSRKQRDSVLSESKIPGAGAVKKAIEVSDTASARSRKTDEYSR
ncbi:MAG: hypothetical protein GF417_11145 [Candidatus Latescibacteria bacterium]|nr:hypothetical protein [bacterium]MBD3424981.1 hypothetical protein [Candidatus Latescibacterota bacterium]